MTIELIILLASLLVAWLVFTWAVQVLKASISTAVAIAAIVLILQLVFGIGPQELFDYLMQLPQTLWNLIVNHHS
ncbi:hypothetical protein PCC9214_01016 [Planktothrix tepida]|uniref:Uncharacterized protein n=2 Tax=Planktothrix TaxID=54304 RepID=A0A1J1LFF0_9CYAN|nr:MULTISPECIES: hypothetical protein [Planktothrix]MBD2481849.1 hypothetical protein [Planktothrix sp. FACHB-1365]CAD5926744.1 hypothetical protein PCC9214_01016 [Planktothrix tepida]CAD5981050.1 hypothetical protein NO713_04759 [Planktothrix pseudagardhii]CUR31311.1 conserved exported hypothetical protein [Planktothrix tepida PCC 9214]